MILLVVAVAAVFILLLAIALIAVTALHRFVAVSLPPPTFMPCAADVVR
jgi:hypothetical protein